MSIRTWLFAGLALAVAAACIRLGIWQLDRLNQRLQANEEIREGLEQPPVSFSNLALMDPIPTYRQTDATGSFDSDHEVLLSPRSYDDRPGYHLVTPLAMQDGSGVVLVDRGWIPYQAGVESDLSGYRRPGTVTVVGVTKPSVAAQSLFFPDAGDEGTWRREWTALDIDAMAEQFPYTLLPIYVAQTEAESADSSPIPQPEINLSRGPHLAYAIQWFGFAAVALVGGGYWLRRRRLANQA